MLTAPSIHFKAVAPCVSFTDRQSDLVVFLVLFTAAKGFPPTFREIMIGTGFRSPAPVYHHLDKLRLLGVLAWQTGRARSLKIAADIKLEIIGECNVESSGARPDHHP